MTSMYLVIWTVSVFVSDPCPDFKPDEYTGRYPANGCLVNHGHFMDKEFKRGFTRKEDAEAFIEKGPKDIKFKLVENP